MQNAPYDEGPEDSSTFRTRLIEHSALPGFRLVVATVEIPVGFAYGYRAHAGDWWAETVFSEIPGQPGLRLDDAFIFMEMAVHPERRCAGIGRALRDSLLGGVECHTALLTTYDLDTPARRLYERVGWRDIVRPFVFPGSNDPCVLMRTEVNG